MSVKDYVEIKDIPLSKDYHLAESGKGFVVPGQSFIASISPEEPVNYVALLHFNEGEPRGNHYHKLKTEYLVVLNGRLRCRLHLPEDSSDVYEVILEPGKIIKILPNCAHVVTAIGG